MAEFTYEKEDMQNRYETFEWDNTWLEQTGNTTAKRVLYIGDSISCGIRQIATREADNRILFDGFGTSKSIDNPYFKDAIKLFAKQQIKQDAIIFNNGLHGWHLNDEKEYSYYYEEMIKFLIKEFCDIPIMIALSTYISDTERLKRIICRNKATEAIAKTYRLPIIDLYSESFKYSEFLKDGVHFTEEGYIPLAQKILSELNI